MDYDPIPYKLGPAVEDWLKVFGGVLLLAAVLALLVSIALYGFRAGFRRTVQGILTGLRDLVDTNWRRVWALAMLTIREAIRRKALMVFVVFAILFMFGGWFLTNSNSRAALQVRVHVSFVLTAITWLILPVVLMLSCWGIPEDIRARSLHTVVTKPARRSEVVLGRFLGFACVGTLVLAIMSVVGFVWINRQLPADVKQAQLICRVPVYGKLSFINREGNSDSQGVNVGDIWKFRSYIEGATKSAAIWEFDGIQPALQVPSSGTGGGKGDVLRFETEFEAFRSHKGVVGKGLLAQIRFVNPEKKLRVPIPAFEVQEYKGNLVEVPRKISYFDEDAKAERTADLFDDLAPDGKLRVEVQCLNSGQYLGMARPDLFVRTPDRPFFHGFFKATCGIWLMTLLVVMLGVTASCFVKGPVATLLTFTLIVIGQGFRELMGKIVDGQQKGGGPVESIIRMVKHMNQNLPLDEGLVTTVVKAVDEGMINLLSLVQYVIPDFGYYSMAPYVANGFDVNWSSALLPSIVITSAYAIPCLLIGYYSLKLRELEAK